MSSSRRTNYVTPTLSSTPASPLPVRPAPREAYVTTADEEPSTFPPDTDRLPGPLPLLVFGLDGTLVYRGGGKGSRNSVHPTPRPYLGPFLEYVFGTQESMTTFQQRKQFWAIKDREEAGNYYSNKGQRKPHGTPFWTSKSESVGSAVKGSSASETKPKDLENKQAWKSHPLEPTPTAKATYRTIIWSSAAAHNVESMARSILTPAQAEQLLRVWSRDTLVPDRWIREKAVTTKDLELVWEALNVSADANAKELHEGEKRVSAQYRYEKIVQDADASVQDLADLLSMTSLSAPSFVRMPQSVSNEGSKTKWTDGRGYGQHNTLMLESEPEKTRLQPYNHLLLPEFYGSSQDDVLLQLVGVLAHARWQRDVSAWIRAGGLGYFGGMAQPGMEARKKSTYDDSEDDQEKTSLALDMAYEKRTQRFWASEGKKALKAAGIACKLE